MSSRTFDSLAEARYLADRWRPSYSHLRIQRGLDLATPAAFAAARPEVPPLRFAPRA